MARILVVDADEQCRSAFEDDLRHEGHEVWTAANEWDALRLADEHPPDLLVTEVQLPGPDGLDLMARVLKTHRDIRVVLISDSPHYKDNFLSWAADACLSKTGGTWNLLATVRELLNAPHPGPPLGTLSSRESTRPNRASASPAAAAGAGEHRNEATSHA
jgi:DNA-binding response OmpR family regulator